MTWGRLIGLMAAGTLAAPVAAQVAPDRSLAGATPSVEDGLSLNAIGDVLYDSNVLRSTGTGLASGMHRDDFRYSPELTATYGRSSGLIALAANAVVGRDLYQYHSYLDRNHYLGGGTLTYHAGSNCQLSVNGTYASRQSGLNGISTGPTSPVVPPDEVGTVIDNVQTTAVYGANAGCGSPTGRLTFGGGYSHAALSNAAAIRKFGDSDSDTYSGNIGLGILRPGQLSLTGSYSTISYPNRVPGAVAIGVPAQLLNTGVNSYRIGFAFSRPIGPRLSGTIGASFLRAEPTGGQAAYTSPAYNFALGYVAGPRLSFALDGVARRSAEHHRRRAVPRRRPGTGQHALFARIVAIDRRRRRVDQERLSSGLRRTGGADADQRHQHDVSGRRHLRTAAAVRRHAERQPDNPAFRSEPV